MMYEMIVSDRGDFIQFLNSSLLYSTKTLPRVMHHFNQFTPSDDAHGWPFFELAHADSSISDIYPIWLIQHDK